MLKESLFGIAAIVSVGVLLGIVSLLYVVLS